MVRGGKEMSLIGSHRKMEGRYDTSGLLEAQYEPGSHSRVLKNLLGITKKIEMDKIEAVALKRAVDTLVRRYDAEHRFTAEDVCRIHETWLGGIYDWAGRYRQVNLSVRGFTFAAADQIPRLMRDLEEGPLRRHTPCTFRDNKRIIQGLAEVHTELVLIHPFREGNGRMARILATLMASQAAIPLLDFSAIQGRRKEDYYAAVRAGLDRDYLPMGESFRLVLRRTMNRS